MSLRLHGWDAGMSPMTATPEAPKRDPIAEKREAALLAAVERHSGFLLGYLKSLTRDPHRAEDLLQTLWLTVHARFRLTDFDSLPLLKNKAKQVFVDDYRRRKTRGFVSTTDDVPEIDGSHAFREAGTPEEEAALQERFWAMFPGIDLEPPHRRAFWMRERLGYQLDEIAAELGTTVSTAHDWINRVKQRCADYLNQEDNR